MDERFMLRFAMTALGDASENWDVPFCPCPSHLCHCEEGQSPDAAIQREHRVTLVMIPTGLPRTDGLAMTRQGCMDCHATMWLAMTRQCVGIAAMGGESQGLARAASFPTAKTFSAVVNETGFSQIVIRRYFDFSPAVFIAITR